VRDYSTAKERERHRIWYVNNREKAYAKTLKWRRSNKEKVRELDRKWREANPEKVRAIQHRKYAANPASAKARHYKWCKNNPDKVRSLVHRRRARLRDASSPGVTAEQWARELEIAGHACVYCGSRGPLTREHLTPICRGGRDEPSNIAPACGSCNSSKGSKTVEEWIEYLRALYAAGALPARFRKAT
jgi:5-methylcytosine-specific restriction endonuclease McrA